MRELEQQNLFRHDPPPSQTFSAPLAQSKKREGMKKAADRNLWLDRAREIAVEIATRTGTVHADAVRQQLEVEGMEESGLGNAAGSIFLIGFEKTGAVHISKRVKGHGNEQKIWRLKR